MESAQEQVEKMLETWRRRERAKVTKLKWDWKSLEKWGIENPLACTSNMVGLLEEDASLLVIASPLAAYLLLVHARAEVGGLSEMGEDSCFHSPG